MSRKKGRLKITTRRGDDGMTDLMFGRRVKKTSLRIRAFGCVDELNAALGLARAFCSEKEFDINEISQIQDSLVKLMGYLATKPEDQRQDVVNDLRSFDASFLKSLDEIIEKFQNEMDELPSKTGWAKPGKNRVSAALDVSVRVCRRAELAVLDLIESDESNEKEPKIFIKTLNRLSDALWLLARQADKMKGIETR